MGDLNRINKLCVKCQCGVCDENVHVGDSGLNVLNVAYARHRLTSYHLEIEERFRSIKLDEADAAFGNVILVEQPISAFGDKPIADAIGPHSVPEITHSYKIFSCQLCQNGINDSGSMAKHLKSVKHQRLESFVIDVNMRRELLNLVGFTVEKNLPSLSNKILAYFTNVNSENEKRICLVCDTCVPASEHKLVEHVNGANHREIWNNLFVNVGIKCSFYCIICDIGNYGGYKLTMIEHCNSAQHRRLVDQLFEYARCGVFF